MYIIALFYEIIWIYNYSKIQNKTKLTNNTNILVPLRLLYLDFISF